MTKSAPDLQLHTVELPFGKLGFFLIFGHRWVDQLFHNSFQPFGLMPACSQKASPISYRRGLHAGLVLQERL